MRFVFQLSHGYTSSQRRSRTISPEQSKVSPATSASTDVWSPSASRLQHARKWRATSSYLM